MDSLETNQNVLEMFKNKLSLGENSGDSVFGNFSNITRNSQRVSRTKAETEELKRLCYERVRNNGERPVDVCRDLRVSKTFLYSSLKEQEIDEEEELNKLRTEFYSVKRKLGGIQNRMAELLEGIFEKCEHLGYPTVEFDEYRPYLEDLEDNDENDEDNEDNSEHAEQTKPKKRGRKKKSDN